MPSRMLALLLSVLAAVQVSAQEAEQAAPPTPPAFDQMASDWWTYFEGPREEVEPRVESFLDTVNAEIADLGPRRQEAATSTLEAVRDNFDALLTLLDEPEIADLELPAESFGYSIEDLLEVAGTAREAATTVIEERAEVSREQRVLDGATRRRDAAVKAYVDATGDDDRWMAALRLVQARSAQAISARRLDLLADRLERATVFAAEAAARVELVVERLAPTADADDIEALIARVEARQAAVDAAEETVRDARLEASGLDVDSPAGRSQQRLEQQRLLDAEIDLALAEILLAQTHAHLAWSELVLDADPDVDVIEERIGEWSELVRRVAQRAPDWERETEDELVAAQSADRSDLDRAARRVLDQRVGTARATLAKAGRLQSAMGDVELLAVVVENALADYQGAFQSWLQGLSRDAQSIWARIAGLGDATLFSISETPVTGDDILRVVLILLVAYLLSRGVRMAIRRVGDDESAGTQASMYTVGRLTHYAIIIFATFIALSSIGLDFRSLALVAGALSVGIGFGLQSIVNNFVSGLIILFEHTLRVGDYIELDNGLTGTVKAINVRSTLINTNDNIDIVVPNSEFVTTRLTNWTLQEGTLRMRIPFGVAYGSDKEAVKKAALEAAGEVQYTLTNTRRRETDVWLVEYGDNSLNFLLLVWVNRQGARRPTRCRSAYLWALETKLNEYGIEIPFPQRDLHLKSGFPQEGDQE
jgi:small-conductance mechanosensitive channel